MGAKLTHDPYANVCQDTRPNNLIVFDRDTEVKMSGKIIGVGDDHLEITLTRSTGELWRLKCDSTNSIKNQNQLHKFFEGWMDQSKALPEYLQAAAQSCARIFG